MNKKEAISYGIIALEYMKSSQYKDEITLGNFAIEMKQAFRLYPRNIVNELAKAKIEVEKGVD